MIKLTKLNGEVFILNCELIEYLESIPESKIMLTNGKYYLANESPEEIIDKIVEYRRRLLALPRIVEHDSEGEDD